ncbi:MAG TPA: histidinol-phosphate transaminase [Tepidisphaeraceae bacterium]|jgi:histidinol-phosphate aminotransferase|nr:histidinol-phosphate transaminase [Tepidisphaeraceae bacterium]
MAPQFVRASVREMQGYEPGEQPAAGERVVKLNTNENPYQPSERVMQAIAALSAETLRRYPNPTADVFRDAAAKLHGVTREHIVAGNGSDDLLTIATRCFVPPGGTLAFPDPTYSLYSVLAGLQDAKAQPLPWERDWNLPVDVLAGSGAHAIYLANPNAPSGTFVSPLKVAELARNFQGLLLVDEAYADFADDNCVALIQQFPNLVITRTLSKAYSLAGLRFGYAIAQPTVIAQMMKVKDSYNCDAVSIIAATAAIEDQAYARGTWENIKSERTRLSAELTQLGWTVLPSQANFILAAVPSGHGKEMYQGLKQQGILVRYFDLPGLQDKIRITIGQSHENNALLAGIKMLTAAGKAA